jgi:hypothetical protein
MSLLGHARGASSGCIGFENLSSQSSMTAPWGRGIGGSGGATFSAPRNRCAGCMTCEPGPICQKLDLRLQRSQGGAQPRGGCTLLVRRFASLTAGCDGDGRAHNRRAVARSLCDDSPFSRFRPACMTCEAWPHVIGWEPWCASGETLPVTLWGTSGGICL